MFLTNIIIKYNIFLTNTTLYFNLLLYSIFTDVNRLLPKCTVEIITNILKFMGLLIAVSEKCFFFVHI